MELFNQNDSSVEPLASRMRPRSLEEFAGQEHILGEGRLLRRSIIADQLSSLIFYGPPGSGKTTLAKIIAGTTKSDFMALNAVLSGVKDIREAIKEASEKRKYYGRRTILFVDEVHRWNKAQQDALLPWVENGTFILIGATTENPYFEVNPALLSRSRIFQLRTLQKEDLFKIAKMALADKERGYGNWAVKLEPGALDHLVEIADGDARSLLNALQLAIESHADYPQPKNQEIIITLQDAEESIQKRALLYDKEGDYHYDSISAFIKSLRGSDPDAALYWMARMIKAGEHPAYLFRRMLICASEDVGLAAPEVLGQVNQCAAAFDRVGMPEGAFFLTQAALTIATAPKSNSALAFFDAMQSVEDEGRIEIPDPLKDANRDKDGLGHGKGYLYPHAFRDHWTAQQYLPSAIQGRIFYQPSEEGREKMIAQEVFRKRELQLSLVLEQEALFSTEQNSVPNQEEWAMRLNQEFLDMLEKIREEFCNLMDWPAARKILMGPMQSPLLAGVLLRRYPEAEFVFLAADENRKEVMERYLKAFPQKAKREIIMDTSNINEDYQFDIIISRENMLSLKQRQKLLAFYHQHLSPGASLIIIQSLPSAGSRLSDFLNLNDDLKEKLLKTERELFHQTKNELEIPHDYRLSKENLIKLIEKMNFQLEKQNNLRFSMKRLLFPAQIQKWLSSGIAYGPFLEHYMEKDDIIRLSQAASHWKTQEVDWKKEIALILFRKI